MLDDVLLFLAVADAGGLAGAAKTTGVSVPTLSRRMADLEGRLGERLFDRGARGYALTARGREFWSEAAELRSLATRLSDFAASSQKTRVRVTAGHWTSRFLAMHLRDCWSPDDDWVPEFVETDMSVDIARREADIGVRNRRPDQPWLAGRRTGQIQYAVFALDQGVSGFVAGPDRAVQTPSAKWLRKHHGGDIVTTASSPRLALDLALAGVGRIVLPIFAARSLPELEQAGPVIDDLTHEEWLVCHHEGRHDPRVRGALEALADLLTDQDLRPQG